MKRQVTASAVISGTRRKSIGNARASSRTPAALAPDKHTHAAPSRPKPSRPNLSLARVERWTHTLVLTGGLDHRSAHTLEAEIERLCDEGVTGITLDLRKLAYIDSIGVAATAFLCGLCDRRGYDFALIAGPPRIHRAFEQAGMVALLPFEEPRSLEISAESRSPRPAELCEGEQR